MHSYVVESADPKSERPRKGKIQNFRLINKINFIKILVDK